MNIIPFGIFISQYLYYRHGSDIRISRGQVQLYSSIDIEEYFKPINYHIFRTFLHKNPVQKLFRNISHFNQEKQTSVPHGPLLLGEKEKEILHTVQLYIMGPLH